MKFGDVQLAATVLHDAALARRNDKGDNALRGQEMTDTVAVLDIKSLKQLALLTHINLTISQRAIYIHYQKSYHSITQFIIILTFTSLLEQYFLSVLQVDVGGIVEAVVDGGLLAGTEFVLFACYGHHDTEIEAGNDDTGTALGYHRKGLTRDRTDANGNGHGDERLAGEHQCQTHDH